MAELDVAGIRALAAWETPVICPFCHEEIRGKGHAVFWENAHSYSQQGATIDETIALCDRITALEALVFDAINEIFCGATYASDREEVFYALDQQMHALTGKRRGGKPRLIDQRDRALELAKELLDVVVDVLTAGVPDPEERAWADEAQTRYDALHAEITGKGDQHGNEEASHEG